ncbi:YD repeat-containing protein [Luteibacter rhizovicinus]|uniref:YD repeat-containing protein n=2 Tax=Luteibacter rhizovicinus TaxID=242606 RepID=A0A4R3YHI9_9GAMM|nr:YD repeat-containing protein [Luteibacter rhizovicinus]
MIRCDVLRLARSVLVVVFVLGASVTLGQTVSIESEYKKLLRVNEDIQPLGPNAFGESISTYDGTVSFTQIDVEAKGTGLPIIVERTIRGRPEGGPNAYVFELAHNAFSDWDMSVPQIETLSAEAKGSFGPGQNFDVWYFLDEPNRCSALDAAGPIDVATKPGEEGVTWEADVWWHGIQLKIPGAGTQDVLKRDAGNNRIPQMTLPNGSAMTFSGVTKQNWVLGCLPATSNGQPGEGFLAVAPDGTKYWLDRLVYRNAAGIAHPGGGALKRRMVSLLVTRAEDRFGNALIYSYDANNRLTSVTASDGRSMTFTYAQWQHSAGIYPLGERITDITQNGATGSRTWHYTYGGTVDEPVLSDVTLPNGSKWTFANMIALSLSSGDLRPNYDGCLYSVQGASPQSTATLTHPSGLSGTFTLGATLRGRSDVPKICIFERGAQFIRTPHAYSSQALIQKQYTGAGIGTQSWSFAYSPPNQSWHDDCVASGCATTVWTDETDPDGSAIRHTFSNQFGATETQLKQEDTYAQGIGSTLVRAEITEYESATAGPWPTRLGDNLQAGANKDQAETISPVKKRTIQQDGDSYIWEVPPGMFDVFARPVRVIRGGGMAGQIAMTEQTTYLDDAPHWVLGLEAQKDNLTATASETISRTVYDLARVTPLERYTFGRKVMTYAFDALGNLAGFTDANNRSTSLGNYKRGIPQSVTHPDSTTQSAIVDDLGQVTSLTDQLGNTISYAYDGIGRLTQITYPAGDAVAWAPKIITYEFVGTERGVAGAHWRRTSTQGERADVSIMDAMLRPVLSGRYRASDGALHIATRTAYDWRGNTTFESYPVNGAVDLAAIGMGVAHTFDVVGRETQTRQSSELGDLTTATAYLSGARKQITDSRGKVTVSTFQVFDQPSYETPTNVLAPEGIEQRIVRNIYGDPTSVTQLGGGQSATKSFVYDSAHRLCRMVEPETASTVLNYDPADNVTWTAKGVAISGTDCGQDQVATPGVKITRGFDAMNRLTSVSYPDGSPARSFTYDAAGNPATATSGLVSWTFGRNKLGLLTTENLSIDGYNWPLSYGYDAAASMNSVTYPDGKVVAYAPDALGRPSQVGAYAAGVTYFPNGAVQSFTLGSGATYVAQQNLRTSLSNFTYGKGAALAISEDLTYDPAANITAIADLTVGGQRSRTMTYDDANRLAGSTSPNLWGTDTYGYDSINNIVMVLTTKPGADVSRAIYYYDTVTSRLSSVLRDRVSTPFTYDDRGNTTGRGTSTLQYDLGERLTSVDGVASYLYDTAGRRVRQTRTGASASTYSAYNGAGQLMWEFDPATKKGTDYIYLGKKLLASTQNVIDTIRGRVDGVAMAGTNATLNGWACSDGSTASISVRVYVGGGPGTGATLGTYLANTASEASIGLECHAAGTAYRYAIDLTDAVRTTHVGKTIYVEGLSSLGGDSVVLQDSGVYVVPPPAAAPSAPASVTATVSSDLGSIGVSWTASANTTRYEVEQQFNGGAWSTVYSGTALTTTIANPADGSYVYHSRACNSAFCSTWTQSSAVMVSHLPPAPTSITVPATSNGPIAVSWGATAYASSYGLEQSINGGAWTTVYAGGGTSATLTAASSGNYVFRAHGCNSNGCGAYVTSTTTVVTLAPSGAPVVSAPSTNTSGSYAVSWTGVSGATNYPLYESINGGGWTLVQQTGATSWSTSGKGNGTYSYYAQACNAGGCGPGSTSATVTVSLIPPPPTNVFAIDAFPNPKTETLTVTWTASPGATRYEVHCYTNGQLWNTTTTSQLVERGPTGEIPLMGYEVRACNAVGCSAWALADSGF